LATAEHCELCEAARFTHWYHEDDICWVADCEVCATPMVVWIRHGVEPSADHVRHMLSCLTHAAEQRFGDTQFSIDRLMRQIPGHFHAHARDAGWRERRWTEPMSLYSGVGVTRRVRT